MDNKNIVLLLGVFLFIAVFNVVGIMISLSLISLGFEPRITDIKNMSYLVAFVSSLMFVRSRWPDDTDADSAEADSTDSDSE